MLLCAFFGLLRLGELVWPDSPDLQVHSQLSSHSSVFLDASFCTFGVPRHKADIHIVLTVSQGGSRKLACLTRTLRVFFFFFF